MNNIKSIVSATLIVLVTGGMGVSAQVIANGTYQVVAQSSGLALTANGTVNGSAITQQTFTGASTQKWTVNNLGNNVVTLTAWGTSEALEVPGATTVLGAMLDVSAYTSGTGQQWTLVPVGGGYYEIVNANSSQEVNVAYGSTSPGGQICQYTAGNYPNGVWSFTSASGAAPATPTGLAASAGNAQVSLSWTASSGATSYNIYSGTSPGGESTSAIATGITTTSYSASGTNGTTYYYKVAAVNSFGLSALSSEVSATPTNPGSGVGANLVLAVGLERLVMGYNGPAIRIQRPSDNTQEDIGFSAGSNALDTSAVSAFLGTSVGWITTLYAQDGTGHNVTAPISTDNTPTISVSAPTAMNVNSTSNLTARNVIMPYGPSGDGNNRYFILPTSISIDKSQMSVFLAYRPDYSGGPYTSLYEVGNPSVDAADLMAGNTGLQGLNHNGRVAFSNMNIMPRSQPTVVGMVTAPGTAPLLYLDGVSHATGGTAPVSAICSGGYLLAGTGSALYYGQSLFAQYNLLGFELYAGAVNSSTAATISSSMLSRGTIPSFNIVTDGDSITQGIGSIYGYNMIRYTEPLLNHPADITNVALEGAPSGSAVYHVSAPTAATSAVGLLYNPSYRENIYYVDMGTNDLIGEGLTAAATWANVQQALQDAKAMGYKTVVATVLPLGGESAAVTAQINAFNAAARGAVGQPYLDAIIDYAADSRLGIPANYYPAYSADGVHPNDAGYQIMSTIAAPVFNGLIGP
jgi:lysophospholipase L1-like esterase